MRQATELPVRCRTDRRRGRHQDAPCPSGVAICLFIVIDTSAAARCVGLFDGYGKYHLAQIEDGAMVAVGDELHGAHPTPGFHFLVDSLSGRRLGAQFVSVRVSRQAVLDHLHPRQVLLALAPKSWAAAASEHTPAREGRSPSEGARRLDAEIERPPLRRHG